jgi:hypothetical protein
MGLAKINDCRRLALVESARRSGFACPTGCIAFGVVVAEQVKKQVIQRTAGQQRDGTYTAIASIRRMAVRYQPRALAATAKDARLDRPAWILPLAKFRDFAKSSIFLAVPGE